MSAIPDAIEARISGVVIIRMKPVKHLANRRDTKMLVMKLLYDRRRTSKAFVAVPIFSSAVSRFYERTLNMSKLVTL